MKKLLLSLGVVTTSLTLSAQTLVNGNFEAAMQNFAGAGYPEVSQTAGWGQGVYVAETTSPGQGAQSAKLVSTFDADLNALYGFDSDTVPGLIIQEINGAVASPADASLSFKYKYAPVGSDVGMFAIEIYDTLAAGFNDDVLLYAGAVTFTAAVGTWTTGTIDVVDAGGTGTANQVYIYGLASAGAFYPDDFDAPRNGSALWLDDVQLSFGTANLNETVIDANVYPNPAIDVLNIEVTGETIATVNITTLDGKTVSVSTSGKVDVSSLNAGMYLYNVTTATGKVSTGNFIKK